MNRRSVAQRELDCPKCRMPMRAVVSEPSTAVQNADEITFHCERCVRDETRIILRDC